MKREIILFIMVALCLAGCGREENPYRVDTVIQIPVDPTEAPTEPEATKIQTEPETAPEETEAPTEKPSSPQKSSGGSSKKNSGTSSGSNKAGTEKSNKKNTSTDTATTTKPVEAVSVQTEPKETAPAATQPPQTEPPTEPPTIPPTEPPTEPPYDPSGYRVGSLEYAVLEQINGYREEAGLPPLSMDEGLCTVASVRAYEISVVWSHTRPDGRSYASVLSDYGYSSAGAAENLIYTSGNGDAAKMVAKWMSADKNCSTLMSESYTTAGIGIYRSGGMTYLANLLIG